MAGGQGGFTIVDFSRERSSFRFHTGAVTAVSLPGLLTQFGTLRTAIEGITLGVMNSERLQVFDTKLSNTPPTDPSAQVERKWLVTYEDNQPFFDPPVNAIPNEGFGKLFQMEIPTADIETAGFLLPNSDQADLANVTIAAFVTAFEAIGRSPYGGTVNVIQITAVGRDL